MRQLSTFVFSSFLAAVGCGDNATSDADESHCNGTCAVVVAPGAAGQPGILSKLDVDGLTVQPNLAAGVVGGDPILRRIGDTLYVINRDVNNVTMVDARTLEYLDQVQIGDSANPQDVAVVGEKLFVPALETAGIVVVTRGENPKTIDVTDALDCKGTCLPRCVSAFAIGSDVYVACGLLDKDFKPTGKGNGKVVVIDATTDTVRTPAIEMPVKNPQNLFQRTPVTSAFAGDLLIPALDYAMPTNGCLVQISPGPNPSARCAVSHVDLQGSATHIDVIESPSPLLLISVTSNFEFGFEDGQLRAFDLDSQQLWSGSISLPTQVINDVAACPNGKIVVADKSGTGGLRVYETAEGELTSSPLSIGLPPGFGNNLVCYNP